MSCPIGSIKKEKCLRPKAIYDRLANPNGFAVGLSCSEQRVTAFAVPSGAEAQGGERTQFFKAVGETEPVGFSERRRHLLGQGSQLLFNKN